MTPLLKAASALEKKGRAKGLGGADPVAKAIREAVVSFSGGPVESAEPSRGVETVASPSPTIATTGPMFAEQLRSILQRGKAKATAAGASVSPSFPSLASLNEAHRFVRQALCGNSTASNPTAALPPLLPLADVFCGAKVVFTATSGQADAIRYLLETLRQCAEAFKRSHTGVADAGADADDASAWRELQSLVMLATDRLMRLGKPYEATVPFNILVASSSSSPPSSPSPLLSSMVPSTATFNLAIQAWVAAHGKGLIRSDEAMAQVAALVTMMQGASSSPSSVSAPSGEAAAGADAASDPTPSGSSNTGPDATTFNLYLRLLCDSGNVSEALNVPRMMGEAGIELNDVTFATMHKGLLDNGRKEEADQLVRAMLASESMVVEGRRPTPWMLANRIKAALTLTPSPRSSPPPSMIMAEVKAAIALMADEERDDEEGEKDKRRRTKNKAEVGSPSPSSSSSLPLVNRVVMNVVAQAFVRAGNPRAALYLFAKMLDSTTTNNNNDSKSRSASSSVFAYPEAGPDTFRLLALELLRAGYFCDAVDAITLTNTHHAHSKLDGLNRLLGGEDSYAVVARGLVVAGAIRLGLVPAASPGTSTSEQAVASSSSSSLLVPEQPARFYSSQGWFAPLQTSSESSSFLERLVEEVDSKRPTETRSRGASPVVPLALQIYPDEAAWSGHTTATSVSADVEHEADDAELLQSMSRLMHIVTVTRPLPVHHVRGKGIFATVSLQGLKKRLEARLNAAGEAGRDSARETAAGDKSRASTPAGKSAVKAKASPLRKQLRSEAARPALPQMSK